MKTYADPKHWKILVINLKKDPSTGNFIHPKLADRCTPTYILVWAFCLPWVEPKLKPPSEIGFGSTQ